MTSGIKKGRDLELYFFCPAFRSSDQDRIEKILKKISRTRRNIRIINVQAEGRQVQEDLFEKHFGNPKTSQLVRRRVGWPPRQLFKLSKTGNAIYLRGVVALAEGGIVQWANKPPESFQFLEDLAARGLEAIGDLYTFSESIESEEVDLLDIFEDSIYCKGNFERSVWLPTSTKGSFINETSKWIDAVLTNLDGHHIVIEAEIELNYASIGQALCYEKWFRAYKNIKSSTPAILCRDFKQEFLDVCKELGITVFSVSDNIVKKHKISQIAKWRKKRVKS